MAGIISLLSNAFQAPEINNVSSPAITSRPSGSYDNNPFISYNSNNFSNKFYAQNKPVKGGYFAGYYNGKQNIVGRRLFIEV